MRPCCAQAFRLVCTNEAVSESILQRFPGGVPSAASTMRIVPSSAATDRLLLSPSACAGLIYLKRPSQGGQVGIAQPVAVRDGSARPTAAREGRELAAFDRSGQVLGVLGRLPAGDPHSISFVANSSYPVPHPWIGQRR